MAKLDKLIDLLKANKVQKGTFLDVFPRDSMYRNQYEDLPYEIKPTPKGYKIDGEQAGSLNQYSTIPRMNLYGNGEFIDAQGLLGKGKPKTPDYVRDLIHVRHLAFAYCKMIDSFFTKEPLIFLDPCEYVGSLLSFAKLFYNEFSVRRGYLCKVTYCEMSFTEPLELVNKIDVSSTIENYDPSLCWDELVNYYE